MGDRATKIRSQGADPRSSLFVDMHRHLGKMPTHRLDEVVGVLAANNDAIAITDRGHGKGGTSIGGWRSLEKYGGHEYSFAGFIADVREHTPWNVDVLPSQDAAVLTKDSHRLVILDNQETVARAGNGAFVEIVTFGPEKFESYTHVEGIITPGRFTMLAHGGAKPTNYGINREGIAALEERGLLPHMSAIEIYNQGTHPLYFGLTTRIEEALALKHRKPGTVVSDLHDYLGWDFDTSGMIFPTESLAPDGDFGQFVSNLQRAVLSGSGLAYRTSDLASLANTVKVIGSDWSRLMIGRDRARLAMLGKVLKQPRQIGSVAEASKYLSRAIASTVSGTRPHVLELGVGTGAVTEALVDQHAKVYGTERDLDLLLHAQQRVPQATLAVDLSDLRVTELPRFLGMPRCDAVVSCLPWHLTKQLVEEIHDVLPHGGTFTTHAYAIPRTDTPEQAMRETFGNVESRIVLRNVPPARVYTSVKHPT